MDFAFALLIALLVSGSAGYGIAYGFSAKGWPGLGIFAGIMYGGIILDMVLLALRSDRYEFPDNPPPFIKFLFFNPVTKGLLALLCLLAVLGLIYFASQYGEGIRMTIFLIPIILVFSGVYAFAQWIHRAMVREHEAKKLYSQAQPPPTEAPPAKLTSSPPLGATIFGVKDDD